MTLLIRRVSQIYVPEVENKGDLKELDELFAKHIYQKIIINNLIKQGTTHEEILDVVEYFNGTQGMDNYIKETEQELDLFLG